MDAQQSRNRDARLVDTVDAPGLDICDAAAFRAYVTGDRALACELYLELATAARLSEWIDGYATFLERAYACGKTGA